MRRIAILSWAIGVALALALSAAHADAQGKGQRNRPATERSGRGVYEDWDYEDYGRGGRRGNGAGRVPPGWCRGVGNPHNTPENCGYRSTARDRRDIYDYPRSGGRSYEVEHREFHRYLDRKYADLASRRPADLRYQLQLRMDKQAEHNHWHQRIGIRH